jgi:hypothetical protein
VQIARIARKDGGVKGVKGVKEASSQTSFRNLIDPSDGNVLGNDF